MKRTAALLFCVMMLVISAFCGESANAALKPKGKLARGFDITADEAARKMQSLHAKAKSWTKATVPQTLDQFPLWPKKLPDLFGQVRKLTLEFKTNPVSSAPKGLQDIGFYSSTYITLKTNIESIFPEIAEIAGGEVGNWYWDNLGYAQPDYLEREPGYLNRIKKNTYMLTDESALMAVGTMNRWMRDFCFDVSMDYPKFLENISVGFLQRRTRGAKRKITISLHESDYSEGDWFEDYWLAWTIQSDTPNVLQFEMGENGNDSGCTAKYNLKTKKLISFSPYAAKAGTSEPVKFEKKKLRISSVRYISGKGMELKWNSVGKGVTYALYRKWANAKDYAFVRDLTGTSYVDPVPQKKGYVYYIEAIDEYGDVIKSDTKGCKVK